jgi:molybdenum cofactor biosynthesis enzyme MoaA
MAYSGYLDGNEGSSAFGWAFDSDRPDESVEVEFALNAKPIGSVRADQFRDDLKKHGLGNGRHAFTFRLPSEARVQGKKLSAQIKHTNCLLKGSAMPHRLREFVGLVAGDIVNNCNLRCPFCIVDYANVRGLRLMTHETYGRALELLPLTGPGNFWLSCLHEPTMHPQFIEFIEAVPDEYRDRISFTTNLSKRLPEEMLARLANSGISSIRVSFDSRRPEVFAELRASAKYELFEQNLVRLSALLQTSRRRPLLHLITMAFTDNYGEIADLVRYGRQLGCDIHEIRYIYYVPHVAHWGKKHILNPVQWTELERSLAPLASPALNICGPIQGTREQFEEERGLADYVARENFFGGAEKSTDRPVPDATAIGRTFPDEPLRLRLRWDGITIAEQMSEDLFKVNLNELEHPAKYFETLRLAAAQGDSIGNASIVGSR